MEVNMDSIDYTQLALLLSPILLIQLGLSIYALVDLSRRDRLRGSKIAWGVLLVVTLFAIPTGIVVSGIYLAWGRQVEAEDDPD
jgi:Na+/H+-dicarboxylate symporter